VDNLLTSVSLLIPKNLALYIATDNTGLAKVKESWEGPATGHRDNLSMKNCIAVLQPRLV
jgi:hypothetical protein